MHCFCIRIGNSAYYVAEDSFSFGSFYLYPNNVLILYAEFFCVCLCEVDMSFRNDNALFELNLAAGSYKLASTRACCISALSDRSCDADRTCVRCGKLYLVCLSARSEDRNVCEGLLGSYDFYTLFASVLTRLLEVLFLCEGMTLSEENFEGLLCNVDVTG